MPDEVAGDPGRSVVSTAATVVNPRPENYVTLLLCCYLGCQPFLYQGSAMHVRMQGHHEEASTPLCRCQSEDQLMALYPGL